MVQIEIVGSTKGIPKKEPLRKEQIRKEYYKMGRDAAMAEVQKDSAKTQQAIADMYSALIIAQAKAMLNSAMVDIYRTLGQVKGESAMLASLVQQIAQNPPPSLTPLVGNPEMGMPPLPVETQQSLQGLPLPPLGQGGGGGGMPPGGPGGPPPGGGPGGPPPGMGGPPPGMGGPGGPPPGLGGPMG